MDKKGIKSETLSNIPLTSVNSGAICRLVNVSDTGCNAMQSAKHQHRGWGERKHGHHWFRPGFHRNHWHDDSGIMRRLLDLGLTKGCHFKIIQGSRFGPVLVEVRGTRIALGHGLARRLIVEVIED